MKNIIFIWEPNDLQIFNSIHDAEKALEAIDVKAGIYSAYDNEGYLYSLCVHGKAKSYCWGLLKSTMEYVIIKKAKKKPNHKEELKKILIDFLRAMNVKDTWLLSATFEELLVKVLDIYKL